MVKSQVEKASSLRRESGLREGALEDLGDEVLRQVDVADAGVDVGEDAGEVLAVLLAEGVQLAGGCGGVVAGGAKH